MIIGSKSQLAVELSRLKKVENADVRLEQYPTDSEIAAEITWFASLRREIEGKVIADLGCGTGILGLSTLILGAEKVFFVDIDERSLAVAKDNLKTIEERLGIDLEEKAVFIAYDVKNFKEKADLVIQNPPFGIQGKKHADKVFLEAAFNIAHIIYSFHKAESKSFIEALSKDSGFKITHYWEFDFPIKQSMKFHKKKIQRVRVGCWRLEKTGV